MKRLLEALAVALPFFLWALWLPQRKASETWSGDGTTHTVETRRERANAHGFEHPSAPSEELPPNGPADSE
jgi:hypothetical protein